MFWKNKYLIDFVPNRFGTYEQFRVVLLYTSNKLYKCFKIAINLKNIY